MNCFTDTSAFYAVLDRDDENHPQAGRLWKKIIENEFRLVTTNYVIVETVALLQSRIGMEAVRVFHEDILPLVHQDAPKHSDQTLYSRSNSWKTALAASSLFNLLQEFPSIIHPVYSKIISQRRNIFNQPHLNHPRN